jgi:hypothetical protein
MFYNVFSDVYGVFSNVHIYNIYVIFYNVFNDALWRILWYWLSTHVVFYDVFSDVHVIYMQCSILYLVMLYGVFSDVHLVHMWCSIVRMFWKISMWYSFKFFIIMCFYFFSLCFAADFIIFIYVMYLFIYFCVYYNSNFINLKLEYCSSKPITFFLQRRIIILGWRNDQNKSCWLEPRTLSQLNERKIFYLYKINVH